MREIRGRFGRKQGCDERVSGDREVMVGLVVVGLLLVGHIRKQIREWVRWLRGRNKKIGGDRVLIVEDGYGGCKDMTNGSVVIGGEVASCKCGDGNPMVGLVVASMVIGILWWVW